MRWEKVDMRNMDEIDLEAQISDSCLNGQMNRRTISPLCSLEQLTGIIDTYLALKVDSFLGIDVFDSGARGHRCLVIAGIFFL